MDDGITKHYIHNAKRVQNPVKIEEQNQLSSIEEDTVVNEEFVHIQNDAPVSEERIKKNAAKSIKSISSDDDFFGSTEWSNSAGDEDSFNDSKAKYTVSEEDNFFTP